MWKESQTNYEESVEEYPRMKKFHWEAQKEVTERC